MEHIKQKLTEISDLHVKMYAAQNELRPMVIQWIKDHRQFANHEIVECYNDNDKYLGDGMVVDAFVGLGKEKFELDYILKDEKSLTVALYVRYKINKIKSNGKPSLHTFCKDARSFIAESDYKSQYSGWHYIKRKN